MEQENKISKIKISRRQKNISFMVKEQDEKKNLVNC